MTSKNLPPWQFEAFRNFLSFEMLQQACAALCSRNGISLSRAEKDLRYLNDSLLARTGREWTPDRIPGGNVVWQTEGSLFRNKKRVFTGFYLLDPSAFDDLGVLSLTDFGQALGLGLVSSNEFYERIVKTFEFPHPAYRENWEWWTGANLKLRPLALILEVLIYLSEFSSEFAGISIAEMAHFGGATPMNGTGPEIAKRILESRMAGGSFSHTRSDALDRKIGDMFGFLAMTPFAVKRGSELALNPLRTDAENSVNSWLSVEAIKEIVAPLTKEGL